jgi:hypothetical protein
VYYLIAASKANTSNVCNKGLDQAHQSLVDDGSWSLDNIHPQTDQKSRVAKRVYYLIAASKPNTTNVCNKGLDQAHRKLMANDLESKQVQQGDWDLGTKHAQMRSIGLVWTVMGQSKPIGLWRG